MRTDTRVIISKHVCMKVALYMEIQNFMLVNSRNANILHATVTSAFSLQARRKHCAQLIAWENILFSSLFAQEKRMFSQANQLTNTQ